MNCGASDVLGPWCLAITAAGAADRPSEVTFDTPALVPGAVGASLVAAGKRTADEPLRLHDRDVWYQAPVTAGGRFRLSLDGLATLAEVFLGDRPVIATRNVFRRHALDLDVATGDRLAIVFRALEPALAAKAPRARWRAPIFADQRLRLVRAPLFGQMPGWTPAVDVVGPLRQLTLQPVPDIEIAAVAARLEGEDGVVDMTVRTSGSDTLRLVADGRAADFVPCGSNLLSARLVLPAAARWWPHTHGEPRLHELAVETGDRRLAIERVGFRRIERTPGDGFGLAVNGEAIFCRGAVFIEADPAGLAATREAYAPWLRLAAEAGMNMIRVPGTMMPPTRPFFDLCDELGLLVWLDFPFANFDYPIADPAFRAEVEAETADVLARTGAAPSLAVLCGGSECVQQAAMMGLPPERWPGPLHDELLAQASRRDRPDALYVANAPSGGPLPFSTRFGVTHYYGVGAYLRPLADLRRAEVGFAAECLAFSNVPDAIGLERDLPGVASHEPRWAAGVPRDRAASWDFEDVREHYLHLLMRVDPPRLRRENPALWLDLSRIVTGEVMTAAFSEWRRGRSPTAGALVYTLMDVMAGAGFGIVDRGGTPKPAWYFLKRILQPVQVMLTDEGCDGLAVHLVNETAAAIDARLEFLCLRDGRLAVVRRSREVSLPPRSAAEISAYDIVGTFFDVAYAYRFGPPGHDVTVARLVDADGRTLSEAVHHPLGLAGGWPVPKVAVTIGESHGRPLLLVESDGYTPFVHLALNGHRPDDDWFPLLPGTVRRVALAGDGPVSGTLSLPGGRIVAGVGTAFSG